MSGPAPEERPVVSVVIVSWNVQAMLRRCLESVLASVPRVGDVLDVIVVDNASSDGSAAMVAREFPAVRLIANRENVGFARANNQAFAHSTGEMVVLLNPDTIVLDNALVRLAEFLRTHPRVGIVGCRLLNGDGSFQRWTGGGFPSLWRATVHALLLDRLLPAAIAPHGLFIARDVKTDRAVDWVTGACLAVRREAAGAELFDPSFFLYGEDTALCERLSRAGWTIMYSPNATVIHLRGQSMQQQESTAVLLSALKGPRQFYQRRHRARWLWPWDLITLTGFLLRWSGFRMMSLLRPGRGYGERALANRELSRRAAQVLFGR